MNPYDILGIPHNSSKEHVKKTYKNIALSCHPDKLVHETNEEIKQEKINKFKTATIAYDSIINNKNFIDIDYTENINWNDIWKTFLNKENTGEIIKGVFVDLASLFMKSNIKPRSYYNPKQNKPINIHNISVDVSYNEILKNTRKKLRLFLIDVDEPVFVNIYCNSFPKVVIEYNDEHDNEHEIVINMELKSCDGYEHIINDSGSIDLLTSIDLTIFEYITGCTKKIKYIDNNYIDIDIPPLNGDYFIKKNGLKNGYLYININIITFTYNDLNNKLNAEGKSELIRILKSI